MDAVVEDAEKVADAEMVRDAENKKLKNLEVVEIRIRITTTNPQHMDVFMTSSLQERPLKTLLSRREEVEAVVTTEPLKTTLLDKLV